MLITFCYQDKSLPQWESAAQVYCPRLSVFSPSTELQAIEHIDVVSTWKGLSFAQAKELYLWQEGFRRAIESIVEKALLARLESQNLSLDLFAEHARDNLSRIHDYVNSLGRRRVRCNLRQLADDMSLFYETNKSHGDPSWLDTEGGGLSDVLNFMQTLYCFPQENGNQAHRSSEPHLTYLTLSFSAQFSNSATCLDLFARVHTQPHHLSLEVGENLQMAFHPPFSSNQMPDLHVSDHNGDVYHVTTTSYFPGNARYERVFRVRLNMTQPSALRNRAASDYNDYNATRRAHLDVPTSNPLRSLSNGSVRVQGRAVSDLIIAASDTHPEFHETYQDIEVRKATIVNEKVLSSQLQGKRIILTAHSGGSVEAIERDEMPELLGIQSETQHSDAGCLAEEVMSDEAETEAGGRGDTLWVVRPLTPSSIRTVEIHAQSPRSV